MTGNFVKQLQKATKYFSSGNLGKAKTICSKILRSNPQQFDALQILGVINLNQRHFQAAIKCFNKALEIQPNLASNYYNLGLAYRGNEQTELAISLFQQAINLKPDMTQAHIDLCAAFNHIKRFEPAISAGKTAVTQSPHNAAAHYHLAVALHGFKDYETAFKHFQLAHQITPDSPSILFHLAMAHQGRGETDIAKKYFRQVTQLSPQTIEPYRQLIQMHKYDSPDHEEILKLKQLEKNPTISTDDRTAIFFSLSKAYRDCGLLEEAFSYADKGNRIQDQKHQFNPDELSDYVSTLIDFFTIERFESLRHLGADTDKPVFIVGTPRSGTTLTEQILCSHPDVFGAGELEWMDACASSLMSYTQSSNAYPECILDLSREDTNKLSKNYLDYINSLAKDESKIADKMPGNFLHLGLIHILFPNAKIIHCCREPKDACISMYLEYFPEGVRYSYNLYKLGAYYATYQRIMEHWHKTLPHNKIVDLNYEDLVRNQKEETQRILDFLGLDWNEACLDFHNTKRRVYTASLLQVKNPIYTTSIGRWKNYQHLLRPLEEGMNDYK